MRRNSLAASSFDTGNRFVNDNRATPHLRLVARDEKPRLENFLQLPRVRAYAKSTQTQAAPRKITLIYDQLATEQKVYAYVDGNPINDTDPYGLYNCPPGVNCNFTPAMQNATQCFENCMGVTITITDGVGPRSTPGSAHEKGEACDIGENANPGLNKNDAMTCFAQCYPNGYGQQEQNKNGGTHYHFQLNPKPGGKGGFSPYVQPYKP